MATHRIREKRTLHAGQRLCDAGSASVSFRPCAGEGLRDDAGEIGVMVLTFTGRIQLHNAVAARFAADLSADASPGRIELGTDGKTDGASGGCAGPGTDGKTDGASGGHAGPGTDGKTDGASGECAGPGTDGKTDGASGGCAGPGTGGEVGGAAGAKSGQHPCLPGVPLPVARAVAEFRCRRAAAPEKAGAPAALLSAELHARGRSGRWYRILISPAEPDGDEESVIVLVEWATHGVVTPLLVHLNGLTPREREVAGLVARGLSTKSIARTLGISGWTVQEHVSNACARVGVHSRRALVARLFMDDAGDLPARESR